jgi:hypothetical protein
MSDAPISLSLSVKGLQRLEGLNHERDFTFIVGEERYSCPSFVAEFLSPRVSSLRSQDITIDEFAIETADPDHLFGTLISMGFGHEICLSEKDLKLVRSVCGELCNYELFENTVKHAKGAIAEGELKARLDFLSKIDSTCDFDVSVIASHFYEFAVDDFDGLSVSFLEAILRHAGLVVLDEDSVFEVVHRRASADSSYFVLLELVRFEFLSDDCMRRAFEFLSDSFESLTFGIGSSLGNRFALPVTRPPQTGRFRFRPDARSPSQPTGFAGLPAMDSLIISSTPGIFSVFGEKTLRLLYRGSRDGFNGSDFHR